MMARQQNTSAPPLNATATPFAPNSYFPLSYNKTTVAANNNNSSDECCSTDVDTSSYDDSSRESLEKRSSDVEDDNEDEEDDEEEAIITLVSLASPTRRAAFPAPLSRSNSPAVHSAQLFPTPPPTLSDTRLTIPDTNEEDMLVVRATSTPRPSKGDEPSAVDSLAVHARPVTEVNGGSSIAGPENSSQNSHSFSFPPAPISQPDSQTLHNSIQITTQPITLPAPDHSSETRTPNVYINGLPPHFPEDQLYALAAPFGAVRSVRTFTRHVGERSSGYGFVLYESVESAAQCIESLRKYRNLHPSFSKQVHKIPGTVYATLPSPAISSVPSSAAEQEEDDDSSFKTRMERLKDPQSTNLYIEGLPLSIDEPTLAALVAPHTVRSSRFFQTKLSHPPRIIAFVRLETRVAAEEVIERLHGRLVRGWDDPGSRIAVRFADTAGQRALRRTERRGMDGEYDEEDTNSSDGTAARLTIAQASLLNLRGSDLRTLGHAQVGSQRGHPLSVRNSPMQSSGSLLGAINIGALGGGTRTGNGAVVQTASGFTPAEEMILQEHARAAVGTRRELGVLNRRAGGAYLQQQQRVQPPQDFAPQYSDVYMNGDDQEAFHVNPTRAANASQLNAAMGRLQHARSGLYQNQQPLGMHQQRVINDQREREQYRNDQLLMQERADHGQYYEHIRSPLEQQQQQALIEELRDLRAQQEELEAREREMHAEGEREKDHAAHIRSTTLPVRTARVGNKHYTHNSIGGMPRTVVNTTIGNSNAPNSGSARQQQPQPQQKQYQSVGIYEAPSRSPTITYNPGLVGKQNRCDMGRPQHAAILTSGVGGRGMGMLKSPPMAPPALTHSPRTPATLSPATPFFGFSEGVFSSNR